MTSTPEAADRVDLGGRLMLVAGATLFSTGGATIKAISLSALQVAGLRSLVAAAVLVALAPSARRGWGREAGLVSIAYAATMTLYVVSNKLATAATAIFLQSTAPLYVMLLGPRLLGERARPGDGMAIAALAVGLGLLVAGGGDGSATAPAPQQGTLTAAVAGVSWALTLLGLRWYALRTPGGSGLAPVAMGNLLTATVCLAAAPWPGLPSARDGLLVGWLGVFQIGLAYVAVTRGLARVRTLAASLILLAQPALEPLWAWVAHGETPGALTWAGGAIVVGTTVVHTLRGAR